MSDTQPRRRRRGVLAVLMGLSVVSLGAGAMSLAIFTDTDASTGSFATGTIDITSSPTIAFTVTGMMPGDVEAATITVDNDGTAQFRYALSTVATNTLGDTLQLTVKDEGTDCATFDGTTLVATTNLDGAGFGDPAPGPQGGELTLDALDSDVLCFQVELPLGTSDPTLQAATSDVTFTFDAEQTANNP